LNRRLHWNFTTNTLFSKEAGRKRCAARRWRRDGPHQPETLGSSLGYRRTRFAGHALREAPKILVRRKKFHGTTRERAVPAPRTAMIESLHEQGGTT
jgi:hypothetical protein